MIWVLLIAAALLVLTHILRVREDAKTSGPLSPPAGTSGSSGSSMPSGPACGGGAGHEIPARLRGIRPDGSAFWDTEEFFARLGEACAEITDNRLTCVLTLRQDGRFSADITFADTARALFPGLAGMVQPTFSGTDTASSAQNQPAYRIAEVIRDDAPSAQIQGADGYDGKTVTLVWNPGGLP